MTPVLPLLFAVHETTSEYTDHILDFFEKEAGGVPILPADHSAMLDHEAQPSSLRSDAVGKQQPNNVHAQMADVQRNSRHKRKTLRSP